MSLLAVDNLKAFYGDMQALFGVSLQLNEGECFSLVGANGAGKSTFLKCLCGLLSQRHGQISFDGAEISATTAERIAREGIAMVPEGRMLFPSLNVEENLQMGSLSRRKGPWNLASVFKLFPILQERRKQSVTTLSGGQQQMVAIGRALMANPKLLLCDEISLGLAPVIVEQIYQSFDQIRAEGMSVVVVEQDIQRAINVSDRLACLLKGRITLQGESGQVDVNRLSAAYFGE